MKRSTKNLFGVLLFLTCLAIALSLALEKLGDRFPRLQWTLKEKIGVLTLEGPILDSKQLIDELMEMVKDRQIKAIVLRIDSPGGGVGPSQEIYKEILRCKESKPVVVSLGSLAASGGYYVASAGNKIVASPGTITGSIGVIAEFVNFQGLFEKIGIDFQVIKQGEFKDVGSPHRGLTDREREMLSKVMEDIHRQFVSDVAKARGLEPQRVLEVADGRIFSGREAMELGLVDELGNFQDAISIAKELAGIKGEPELVYPKKRNKFLTALLEESSMLISKLSHRLYINPSFLTFYLYHFNPPQLKTY